MIQVSQLCVDMRQFKNYFSLCILHNQKILPLNNFSYHFINQLYKLNDFYI